MPRSSCTRLFYDVLKDRRRFILVFACIGTGLIMCQLYMQAGVFKPRNIINSAHVILSGRQSKLDFRTKDGGVLNDKVRTFHGFLAELDNSHRIQFDDAIKNFNYSCSPHASEDIFAEEFERIDSFPSLNKHAVSYGGYIGVFRVGQELSQCSRHLLELCLYAATSQRKVVTPRMGNGHMGIDGLPFGDFFNVSELNRQLVRFGYSELATEAEFEKTCKTQRIKVVVVFHGKPTSRTRSFAGVELSGSFQLYEKALKWGWTNCTKQMHNVPTILQKNVKNIDVVSMVVGLFKDVKRVNSEVFGDSSCVFINQWNHMWGFDWDTMLPVPNAPNPKQVFQLYADPTSEIVNEVDAFRRVRIQRPYVAIHIRGAKFRNKTFLQPCFDVALVFVKALRRTRKVNTLFLSTDMSQYGGLTNHDKYTHQTFAEQSNAVIYDPNVANGFKTTDRWKVSLSEVRLMSQSDHLITIGQGSFGGYIRRRYIIEHRNRNLREWTLTKICYETSRRWV